ncbi:MAG TPA: hypothetical protein V6D08_08580 [Candidatus Obscuribacterales bacterium]
MSARAFLLFSFFSSLVLSPAALAQAPSAVDCTWGRGHPARSEAGGTPASPGFTSDSVVSSWALAQAPVPGQSATVVAPGAPVPGQQPAGSPAGQGAPAVVSGTPAAVPGAPVPGLAAPGTPSAYQQLPLSANDAQSRLDELRSLLPGARPKDLQEPVYQMCEWLTDMAEAHYKLANSFSKHDSTRAQAELERRTGQKFSHLKNEAQLLKAELLIRQQRYPEALGPLVEVVVAEPRTATGQAAYKKLKEIGFAEEAQLSAGKPAEPQAPAPAPPVVAPGGAAANGPAAAPPASAQKASANTPVGVRPAASAPAKPNRAAPTAPLRTPTLWLTGSPAGSR